MLTRVAVELTELPALLGKTLRECNKCGLHLEVVLEYTAGGSPTEALPAVHVVCGCGKEAHTNGHEHVTYLLGLGLAYARSQHAPTADA